jgi:uncharacterized spore protein YtfJ
MNRKVFVLILAGLCLWSAGGAQNPAGGKAQGQAPQPAYDLAAALAQRLSGELNVKTAVGQPVKAGAVTLIPIVMIDVSFGGGGMSVPGGKPPAQAPQPAGKARPSQPPQPALGAADGFFMSGEARPLGFVAVTKKGTRFIGVGRTPGK